MLYYTKTLKKIIGSFLGVASASALISFPGLAQTNWNSSSSNSSSQSILAQGVPSPTTPANGSTSAPGSTKLSALDREFITKAAQSDLTEIQTSQLALKRSQDKSVRDFAQHMIHEHTTSSTKLSEIAKAKGVTLPKNVGPENQALVTKLTKLNGNNFNQAYIQGQTQAHTKTLAEYQKYLQQGQDPQLTGFASEISPIVAQHLELAKKLNTNVK